MCKINQRLNGSNKVTWVTAFCLLFPLTTFASSTELLPRYSFTEFNIAFILGLSLPLLLILALFKPTLKVKWHYPALLTLSLLALFYSFTNLTQWQIPAILMASGLFTLIAFLWIQQDLPKNPLNKISQWTMLIASLCFIGGVVVLREVDVFQLWLGYLAIQLSITAVSVTKADTQRKHKLRVLVLSAILATFGGALYFWLNTQASLVWVISLSVLSYLFAVINGCWGLVDAVNLKVNDLKLALESQKVDDVSVDIPLDPVSNLPTYQHSLSVFKQAIQQASSNNFVAIVFKPLNFYQVNKVLGHQNSDILLLQLAFNLQRSVGDNELLLNFNDKNSPIRISRLQGLDFLIVLNASLSNYPVKIVIEDICNKLVKAVPQAMSFKSFSLSFELAFGAAISEKSSNEAEQLVAHASDALLEGERGEQQISYYNYQSAIYTEQHLAKMEKLRQDIVNNNIVWLAHPQVSLASRTLTGFELAIDWQTNDGMRLAQHEFDEIAEFSGEIYQLTKQMIKQAFYVLSVMHQQGIKQSVSINLSSKNLLEAELADYIERQAIAVGVPLEYLVIELCEKVLLDSAFRARMMVDQLKALGIQISIDGFSGSYESLRYLRRTSIQQVKIDCALLNNEQSARSEKTIVNALINLIRKMNIPIVATGINNQEIERSYLAIGGDVAQGNIINQGVLVSEIATWLTQWHDKTKQA
ncbi:EAL domain-containing protein [Colwelliaceae bacterium 6441]